MYTYRKKFNKIKTSYMFVKGFKPFVYCALG